jgi:hypothetical protein
MRVGRFSLSALGGGKGRGEVGDSTVAVSAPIDLFSPVDVGREIVGGGPACVS